MHPLARIGERCAGDGALVAGCLSGTSADGIDVGIARFRLASPGSPVASEASEASAASMGRELEPPELVAFRTLPFEPELGERVRGVLDATHDEAPGIPWRAAALLSRDLGLAFGAAVRSVADERGLALDLVGSHGQTVWHHDGRTESGADGRATLQLGGGAFVASAAGVTTVSDFRQADIAAGGEGAPLSALVDPLLFRAAPRPLAILNLGGIANLTLLDRPDSSLAFDTGPAGSLLDGLARRLLARPYDAEGAAAATGRVHDGLLAEWASHPYFDRSPPKSTGRDTFGEPWVEDALQRAARFGLFPGAPAGLLATAVELVARTVADALERFGPPGLTQLILAGGGTHNLALRAALTRACGVPALSSAELGVDPDAREALVFGALAVRCALGLASTRPWATKARAGACLGAVHFAPRPGERVDSGRAGREGPFEGRS